jgi:hypothetical protein
MSAATSPWDLERRAVGRHHQHDLLALVAGGLDLGASRLPRSRGPFSGSSPASVAMGVPGQKKPGARGTWWGRSPDRLHEVGLVDRPNSARRMAGLSKGGCRWLAAAWSPCPSGCTSTLICRRAAQQRQQVVSGYSHQSCSPCWSAAEVARRPAWCSRRRGRSGRSSGPPSTPSARPRAACSRRISHRRCGHPARVHPPAKRNGPLPTISVIWVKGRSWPAARASWPAWARSPCPAPRAAAGKGLFRRKRMVRSSGAESSSVASHQRGCRRRRASPSADAGHAIPRQHLLTVMPQQAGAQRQVPELAVILDGVAFETICGAA